MTREEEIYRNLTNYRDTIQTEYQKAKKEKDTAKYPSVDYLRALEKVAAYDLALMYFDLYTASILSAGD